MNRYWRMINHLGPQNHDKVPVLGPPLYVGFFPSGEKGEKVGVVPDVVPVRGGRSKTNSKQNSSQRLPHRIPPYY